MIIVSRPFARLPGQHQIIALFGIGLLGGAVWRGLTRCRETRSSSLPLNWLSPDQRRADLELVTRAVSQCCGEVGTVARLDVVWTAGKAGFAAGQEELDLEMAAFQDIAQWSARLHSLVPRAQVAFHMMSSAGGLFEGQRFVDRTSVPKPRRCYGQAKLDQESFVQTLREEMDIHIYRPSSVYGASGLSGRAGLVNTLIENANKHASSRISGGLDTVRDYVLSSDVGDFVARRLLDGTPGPAVMTLASGKPTSVMEMLGIVGAVVNRPLYIKLEAAPTNASPISFRPSALPAGWFPTDLETGIRRIARQLSPSFARVRDADSRG